jgi:hypothetical protein
MRDRVAASVSGRPNADQVTVSSIASTVIRVLTSSISTSVNAARSVL